jgi:acetyl esterase/lipase
MDLAKATGIGFVVFPGGGYTHLDMERHATALANRVGPQGIAVFGLKYRVGQGTNDARRDALLDANRAIRLVRQRAAEWGVHPEGVGVVSYSAGSHLAMNLAGHFDLGQASSDDPVEAQSSRPAFFASMCTWDSGNSISKFTFLKSTPPVYLCHAKDDTTAPIALAYAVEKQLQALNVAEHLEVYATGGHDSFNVGEMAEGHDWPDKFMTWLATHLAVH